MKCRIDEHRSIFVSEPEREKGGEFDSRGPGGITIRWERAAVPDDDKNLPRECDRSGNVVSTTLRFSRECVTVLRDMLNEVLR